MRHEKKYFYHLTYETSWGDEIILEPLETGCNRPEEEMIAKRICVSDEIEKCLTAIPFRVGRPLQIYRTKNKVRASHPPDGHGIFDISVTDERWIRRKTSFVRTGVLSIPDAVIKTMGCPSIIGKVDESRLFLEEWRKIGIRQYIT